MLMYPSEDPLANSGGFFISYWLTYEGKCEEIHLFLSETPSLRSQDSQLTDCS